MKDNSNDIKQAEELFDFIKNSPSCYHVIANLKNMLNEQGFIELMENENWYIENGGKYYTTRGGSSIIVFYVPNKDYSNYQITASHSDSPSFKIKENPEMLTDGHYVELNVEKYGGMICSPWFDRPLSIAGRVVAADDNMSNFTEKLVNVDRNLVMIPNVAIHMNRDVNNGYAYNAQKDMIPILGEASAKDTFYEIIAESAGVAKENIVATDLFLYNRVEPCVWGANNEFISSTKLDDLECAYTTIKGFINGISYNNKSVSVCCVFDNEEVGSSSKQGAASTLLRDTLIRICEAMGKTQSAYRRYLANSFMISADNAHAVHPNYTDKACPTNRPYMNGGIVIKYSANQKYTTDGMAAGIFQEICKRADVPYQTFLNRSDMAGGSTLGNISNTQVALNTVDIGLPQLAMHSPYETAGSEDTGYLIRAAAYFFESSICESGYGSYTIKHI